VAIVKMQKLSVCANKKNRKAILEQLQSLGCMEITTEGIDDPQLQKMDTDKQRQQFLRNADAFDEAIRLLDRYAKAPSKGGGLFAEK
jgi:V/A-type H+-transporting ATPase subunit I